MRGKVAERPEKRPGNRFHEYRHARQQSTGGRNPETGPSAVRLHLLKPDFVDAGQFSTERRESLGAGSDAGIDGA